MNILWIERPEYFTSQRARDAAVELGINVHVYGHVDMVYSTTGGLHSNTGVNLLELCDAVVIRNIASHVSEALTIARLFADAGKPVFDPVLVQEGYAISKMHDYLLMTKAGLPVPRTVQTFTLPTDWAFPYILKGVHGAQGKHVHLAHNQAEAEAIWAQYPPGALMLQEFLEARSDYRILVCMGKALPYVVEKIPLAGDFRTNFAISETVIGHPAANFPDFIRLAEESARLLKRNFTGVDIRTHNGQPYILEVNRSPGFKGFEQATGYHVAKHYLQELLVCLGKAA